MNIYRYHNEKYPESMHIYIFIVCSGYVHLRPQDLITALVRDMASHLSGLEQARGEVEAGVSCLRCYFCKCPYLWNHARILTS